MSGWLALVLLAVAAAEAATITHLYRHRAIEIQLGGQRVALPTTMVTLDDDYYVTHTFPSNREVCDSFDTICYIKI